MGNKNVSYLHLENMYTIGKTQNSLEKYNNLFIDFYTNTHAFIFKYTAIQKLARNAKYEINAIKMQRMQLC